MASDQSNKEEGEKSPRLLFKIWETTFDSAMSRWDLFFS